MRRAGLAGCVLAFGVLIATGAAGHAADDETGVAAIHDWVKIGRKTCFVDHFHSGSGNGKTRAQAERQAIQSWADFTAWEYGTSWGHYGFAASKKMECDHASDGFSCFVEARPCRGW